MLRSKERPLPAPTYMSEDQKAEYLRSLRASTFTRPSGSRPAPASKYTSTRRSETDISSCTVVQGAGQFVLPTSKSTSAMPQQTSTQSRSSSSATAKPPSARRPVFLQPSMPSLNPPSSTTEEENCSLPRKPSIPYLERGTRWMEKQEVASIRRALHDMDLDTEEEQRRIHATAQDEAAELVYRHQNPDATMAPYPNPDLRRDYHSHLRKGSYVRSHGSQDGIPVLRKTSNGSHDGSSSESSITSYKRRSMDILRNVSPPSTEVRVQKRRISSSGKSYGALAEAVADDIAKAHRRSSSGSGSRRNLSGEKKRMYMHPDDRIWEDPQEETQSSFRPEIATQHLPYNAATPTMQQPVQIRKNPFARVRMQAEKLERSRSEPIVSTAHSATITTPRPNRVEIHRNPPSQSRRPWYTSNVPLTPPAASPSDPTADEVSPKVTPTRADGKEVRSDDIRTATSKKRNEYSPKLPRPTVVSDKPGRAIVSFDQDWRPTEVPLEGFKGQAAASVREPEKTRHPGGDGDAASCSVQSSAVGSKIPLPNGGAPVPTINQPKVSSVPTIVLSDESNSPVSPTVPAIPAFNIEPPEINIEPPSTQIDATSSPSHSRMMPQAPNARGPMHSLRPSPTHAATSPLPVSRPHYTPSIHQSNTLCAQCALPIAGRILSASGARFHPSCFTCHACHTNLELVAFYAEPEKAHAERISRIQARCTGLGVPGEEGLSQEQLMQQELLDGHDEETPRFYCHLDFHELFSPRCKSCKTPIEGEVIVACGAEWHAGHFFCAQCGDPFDSSTPFVEKDGYAWCVSCHTNRYSAKCRKCRKPVIDMVVKALGAEWHAPCFVCEECGGQFQDGRYFLRGSSEDPVCVRCEERRLKS